jgi:thiosulfate/3-mercaptopyruvate sulfurtransferase
MLIRNSIRGLTGLVLLAFPNPAPAADEKQHQGSPLITHEQLQERLHDPKLRLLDARPRPEYDQSHIPGAVWVDTKAIQELGRPDAIRDEVAWSRALAPLGINEDTREVFVYDSARQHDAARVWWTLSYAGLPRVGLVDGGFGLWQKEKRPVSTDPVVVASREFKPSFRAGRLATRDEVRQASTRGGTQLLDARSPEEYRGERQSRNSTAAGHIPGARNLDGYALVDADGRFLEKEGLSRRLSEAGIAADRPVIAYSQGGNRSAIVAFALDQFGAPVRHYVPGLSDWSQDANAPIAAGREPGK